MPNSSPLRSYYFVLLALLFTCLPGYAQTVVTVTVSPATASVVGGGTQQFTASLSNTVNKAVTWAVNGIAGGDPTVGTVSASGLYTAPTVISGPATKVIAATSQADAAAIGKASVTWLPVTMSLSPTAVTLLDGEKQQFTATVLNTPNKTVTWSVNGVVGGSASTGTVSAAGLYSAPAIIVPAGMTVTLKAVSQANPSKVKKATITLKGIIVTIAPTAVSLGGGGTQQFTATLQNAPIPGLTWQVNGFTGGTSRVGTITQTGLYTAPAVVSAATSVRVIALSPVDPHNRAISLVNLTPPTTSPVSVTVAPSTASLAVAATKQFTATVTNTANIAVTWKVNGVTGGSAATGTITTAGLYTAPASVAATTVVTVVAVAQADTTKSGSAQVTINPAATNPVTVMVTPTSASLNAGSTQQFTATVANTANKAVTWSVNGVSGGSAATGTISTAGLYTAPASLAAKTTVTVAAVSQADPTKSGSAQVTVTPPVTTTGNSFYVATTGSDANAGTLALPWKTISHAAASSLVQPGDTVFVRAGTYTESVNIGMSGSAAAGPVTFQNYPGEKAILDGTGLKPPTDQNGLFNVIGRSYVTIAGFEIRNYVTSSSSAVPAGIWVTGSGSHIKILNNIVHDIKTTSEASGNAFGIAVYGTEAPASIDLVTIDGNEVYNLRTGGSESVNVDGNVTNFAITNNLVHDNDNIAIDAIGYEGVSSNAAYDRARNGVISDNTIYNISGKSNPGEGNDYDADGIYVDGGTQIIIERNLIHNVDLGIEVASEHKGTVASFVTVRNNVIYASNITGISIGGYSSNVGGTDNCMIVNNTLYGNDTQNSGSGEFQVQYFATNNVFKNNILYASSQGLFINNFTKSEPNPVDVDYNLYYTANGSAEFLWNGADSTSFASYQSSTGKDPHSKFSNPFFLNLNLSGLNLDVLATSPAVNAGTNLGAIVEGSLDFAGGARVQGSNIDIGAFEQ